METETPRAVPLTAASLAMLESPEYGEDPSTMLLRRVLSSPHEMGNPNAPDDGDRRRSMELDAPLAGPSGASPASRASLDTTGSFVAYLAPRGASAADSTRFADAFAEKLGDGASRGVGARGAVAHERDGVATFVNRRRVVLFCGALTNRAALAADAFDDETPERATRATNSGGHECFFEEAFSRTAPELIDRLYDVHGTDFVDRLEGSFAFAVVDGEGAAGGSVFAAVDRRGTLPLVKGRCASGGVVVAHVGVGADRGAGMHAALDRAMAGGASRVPAGTYVSGNRHAHPHRYCRSAEAERALRLMHVDAGDASLGTEAEVGGGDVRVARRSRTGSRKEKNEPLVKSLSRRSSLKALEGLDVGLLGAWSSQSVDLDGEGDATCESRMGAAFKEAEGARLARGARMGKGEDGAWRDGSGRDSPEPDALSRLGSGASDQSAVKVAAPALSSSPRGRFARSGEEGRANAFSASECYVSLRG